MLTACFVVFHFDLGEWLGCRASSFSLRSEVSSSESCLKKFLRKKLELKECARLRSFQIQRVPETNLSRPGPLAYMLYASICCMSALVNYFQTSHQGKEKVQRLELSGRASRSMYQQSTGLGVISRTSFPLKAFLVYVIGLYADVIAPKHIHSCKLTLGFERLSNCAFEPCVIEDVARCTLRQAIHGLQALGKNPKTFFQSHSHPDDSYYSALDTSS